MENQLIKICGIAILCVAVLLIIRELKINLSWSVRICGILLVGGVLALSIGGIWEDISTITNLPEISEYTSVIFRALGVSLLARICADICRDCGEASIAFGVESAGKLCVLYMCIPVITDIITYSREVLRLGDV